MSEIELRDGVCCKTCHIAKTGFCKDTVTCKYFPQDDPYFWKLCRHFVRREEDKE